MKKVFVLAALSLSIHYTQAQEPLDAIRYSWMTSQGTARAQSIGGATTALGGDITALFSNPSGLGMYKTGEFVFTPGLNFVNNKSEYRGSNASDSRSSFNFGPIGLVYGIPARNPNSKWKNVTLGVGLNRTANFNSRIYVDGENNQSSYSEKYIDQIYNDGRQGRGDVGYVEMNYPYGPSLAYQTYLIDTITKSGGQFEYFSSASDILATAGLRQQQVIRTKGGITDFNIGFSGNYNDVFYLGGAISINNLSFTRNSSFTESDLTNNANNYFNYFTATDYLKTEGVGASVKLGVMVKPVESLRVGFSFHSPSWYSMKDIYTSDIVTDTETYQGEHERSSTEFNDGYAGEYTYRYKTPMRAALGLAYMFGAIGDVKQQNGFITADIEYVDYKHNSFNSQNTGDPDDKDYFNELNTAIDNSFKNVINMRIGGELKFNTFMVRAGFGYYGNPYTSKYFDNRAQDITKGSRMNITGGLGWRDKGIFVDLAYVHQIVKDAYYPYRLDLYEFNPARVDSRIGSVLLTVGFKF